MGAPVRIVYFDGHCNVCNAFIDFLIRRDSRGRLCYAPLQGETARTRLPSTLVTAMSTMALEENGAVTVESTAAIRTIAVLGGPYLLMKLFLLVPRFLRDGVYRWIAKHRYLWWGRRDTCRVPTPEERTRFLP
jgi:predicted DCC family thiol-disulfide oxidoreductase YuxK